MVAHLLDVSDVPWRQVRDNEELQLNGEMLHGGGERTKKANTLVSARSFQREP